MTVQTSKSFQIDGCDVGAAFRPYIIAELSGNHNGSLERALDTLVAAKEAGASAVKLQTYTADTITIDHDGPGFVVDLPLWKNRKLHTLYQEAHTPWDWHPVIFEKGRELGITVFSSPFDPTAVDFLESLGAPAYKIASFELVDIPLIERCAATGKPLIMSTGMSTEQDILDAVSAARNAGARDLALLHCVSAYPALPEDSYLRNISELAKRFDVVSGLSDHTLGTSVAIASVALGAAIIEKHVTLARADGGVDSAFSLEPRELKFLVGESNAVHEALAGPKFAPKSTEQEAIKFRRSLYVVEDVPSGGTLTERNVRSIRPAFGLAPKHYKEIVGRRATRALKKGEPVTWDMIERT
jgi:pseudaminic acid synthase